MSAADRAPGQRSAETLLLRRADVERCLEGADPLGAVREALIAFARGEVGDPGSIALELPRGEAHVKGAHLAGSGLWTVKLATGVYDNPERGLPSASGMSLVASAETGEPLAIVLDGGLLTDLRTAAAGAVAIDALAPPRPQRVALVGCGVQAGVQLEYLLRRRSPESVAVWGRDPERAARFAAERSRRLGVAVEAAAGVEAALQGAEVVVTATPATGFLVEAAWLHPEATVLAVGADMPGKQELEPTILERAELLVADDPAQAAAVGELQHAPDERRRALALGDVLAEPPPRRRGWAVVDLTGLGAEDAAIAALVLERARELGIGDAIAPG